MSYTGKDGETKTTTATKADDGTWSITSGDGSVGPDGVVAIPTNLIKGGTEVKAKVTDNGEYDKSNPLQSDEAKLALEKTKTKADKVKELGGLDPVVMKKWVGDKVDWKDGVKAKDDAKKSEVEELLKGATFEDVTEEKRSTTKEGDFEGKIKITFDDKSELVVEKQMLYVSNHVTSTDRKDKVPTDALDVEFKLGEGTKVDNTGSGAIEGNKDKPTSYSKYKVKPNTNLKEYRIPAINASAVDSIKLSAQDGYADPTWNTNNFVATTKNNVFTATATQEFKVNFLPGEGQGSMEEKKVKKGDKFTIPSSKFKAPKDKVFAGWTISGKVGVYQPNGKIDISGNITLTATWKPKPSQPGGPSGPSRPDNGGSDVTPPIIPPIIPEKTPEETPTDTSDPKDSKSPENKPKDKTPGKEDPKNPSGENSKEPGKEKDKNEEGKKPGVEDRLRIRYNPNGGHWNDNSTDILTYYYDRGNIITLINPPTREGYRFLYWKGSAYQPGDKYTVVDDHMFVAQWEKIGTKASRSNPKTGLESVAGIVCTLVGSTGALYIGRKKED